MGICYEKVKEDRGYNRALGNTSVDNYMGGIGIFVGIEGHPATQVAG